MSYISFKDKDGFHYKFPERSCSRCRKYPCLTDMDQLKSDFAKFGCTNFLDENHFE